MSGKGRTGAALVVIVLSAVVLVWAWLSPADSVPRAAFSRDADGLLVGTFESGEVAAFLSRHGLVAPAGGVPPAEAGIAETLESAFAELKEAPGSRSVGRVGQILDYLYVDDAARACYARAGGEDPREPRWPHLLGRLEARSGRPEAAERWFRAALALRPDPATQQRLADLLARQGRTEEADALLRDVLQRNPGAGFAALELARLRMTEGAWPDADALADRVLAADPNSGAAHAVKARTAAALGREEEAARHARQAGPARRLDQMLPDSHVAELVPVSGALLNRRRQAQQQFDRGDLEGMIRTLSEVVERDSSDAGSLATLITTLEAVGRPADGDATRDAALRRHPADPKVHEAIGRVAASRQDWTAALRHTGQALEFDPDLAAAHSTRAVVLVNLNRYDEALRHARRARELDPGDAKAAQLVERLTRR